MNPNDLQSLFSQPPASFVWTQSKDGSRTMGAAPGAVIDLWHDRVELAALMPPDRVDLAAHNAALMLLLVTAMRRDWITASDWLTTQMRMAGRATGFYEGVNYSRRVSFTFDRRMSRATLKVKRV